MALGIALKVILSVVTGTAVAVPVSYLVAGGALGAFEEVTYVNGERCLHFPIKSGEVNKKLYVCKKKEKEEPIFKWWTKDSSGDGMREIETLSWNKKNETADSTNDYLNYELEVTLKQGTSVQKTITEKGRDDYIPVAIKQLEKSCTFKSVSNKQFVLLCQEDSSVGTKKHQIPVNFYG